MKKNTKKNMEVQNEETLQAVQETAIGLAEADLEATSVELQDHRDNPVEAALEDEGAAKPTRKKSKRKKRSRAKVSRREEPAEAEASVDSAESESVSATAEESSGDSLADVLGDHAEMEATLEELSREIESAAELFGESVSEETSQATEENEVVTDVPEVTDQTDETSQVDAVVAEPETQTDESVFEQAEALAEDDSQAESDWQDEFASIDCQDVSAEMSDESEPIDTEEPIAVENAEDAIESAAATEETAVASDDSAVTEDIDRDTMAMFDTSLAEEPADTVQETAPTILPQPEPVHSAWDGGQRYSQSLMVHHDRGGKIAEEYRALRTNLLSKCPTDRFCFMVTSAEAGEGKTVTCLNLALVLAERRDRRTIVVDYNLRQGGVAEMLGAKHGPGVAEVVQGRASLEEAIQPTVYPNLYFLSAGQSHAGQAGELMSRSELKSMVETLRDRFDYVLVDTPAVNHYSDAGITGLITGDALMVVRMNKTPREAVHRAIQSLKATNVNVVGMLLTHRRRHLFN